MPRLDAMNMADLEAAGARWYETRGRRAGEDDDSADPDDELSADPADREPVWEP